MSLTIDGNASLGPGPHTLIDGGLDRAMVEGRFPGQVGTKILTMHGDRNELTIAGELTGTGSSASAAKAALAVLVAAINGLVQDGNHTIVDDLGCTWTYCLMASWKQTGPRKGPIQDGAAAAWTVAMPYTSSWIKNDFTLTS
jgi:hypothetical protein